MECRFYFDVRWMRDDNNGMAEESLSPCRDMYGVTHVAVMHTLHVSA